MPKTRSERSATLSGSRHIGAQRVRVARGPKELEESLGVCAELPSAGEVDEGVFVAHDGLGGQVVADRLKPRHLLDRRDELRQSCKEASLAHGREPCQPIFG